MLIPKEPPYMDGLNSYYLDTVKFIEHLQGEIGNGSVYFKSSVREILVYFDEMDIISGVIQESGGRARLSPSLRPVFDALQERNYLVRVYRLDPNAIFYWAQLPPYKRAKSELTDADISLAELVEWKKEKKLSGFIEVTLPVEKKNCILFFQQGNFAGGSYSWGAGGLNHSTEELRNLIETSEQTESIFAIGRFPSESRQDIKGGGTEQKTTRPLTVEDQVFITNLPTMLEEFINLYLAATKKKLNVDPMTLLKQRLVVRADDYPFLDPFNLPFEFANGIFTFTGTDHAFGENTARAIIDCVWDVVAENRLQKKFRKSLEKWSYRSTLELRQYQVMR